MKKTKTCDISQPFNWLLYFLGIGFVIIHSHPLSVGISCFIRAPWEVFCVPSYNHDAILTELNISSLISFCKKAYITNITKKNFGLIHVYFLYTVFRATYRALISKVTWLMQFFDFFFKRVITKIYK